MMLKVVLPKKLFLFIFIFCSFSLKAETKTCIDFTSDGIVPLIILLQEEILQSLSTINIKINVQNESILDILSGVISKETTSIIDALDEDADFVKGLVEASTLSIIDEIGGLEDLKQLIKDRNVSKSGNIVRCTTGESFEITSPGYYALEDNTNCCIYIRSDDVTVDLNDFTLSCTTDDVIKTFTNLTNIKIKNGKIKGNEAYYGILINDSCQLAVIENVKIFDCSAGVRFSGIDGGLIKDCVVNNCNMTNCLRGINIDWTSNCVFKNSNAISCFAVGFRQADSSYNIYENCSALNTLSDTPPVGLLQGFLSLRGTNNLYSRCKAIGTGRDNVEATAEGFAFTGEMNSKIVNCITNETMGWVGRDPYLRAFGIFLGTSQNCTLEANETLNSNGYGIGFVLNTQTYAQDNLVIKNIGYNNTVENFFPSFNGDNPFNPGEYIRNVYVYDHDNSTTGNISPLLLDNLDIVGP